jgi:hypothetical protein
MSRQHDGTEKKRIREERKALKREEKLRRKQDRQFPKFALINDGSGHVYGVGENYAVMGAQRKQRPGNDESGKMYAERFETKAPAACRLFAAPRSSLEKACLLGGRYVSGLWLHPCPPMGDQPETGECGAE